MHRFLMIRGVAIVMVCVFLFAPLSYDIPAFVAYVFADDASLIIDADTTWSGEMDFSHYETIDLVGDARLTIEPGARIVIPTMYWDFL